MNDLSHRFPEAPATALPATGSAVAARLAETLALALALLLPALANGFPLVFPDSGTYLGIALGHDYAIDRSSFYGFMLKPVAALGGGISGLWLAIGAQALGVAAALVAAARALVPAAGTRALALAGAAVLTSLPWHAGQFMPDALTGPLILIAALAALRDPRADGAAGLWAAAILCALVHYTHLVLLPVAACAAIGAQAATGLGWRGVTRRLLAAALATGLAAGAVIGANAVALGRTSVSPVGGVFLFARLHEDGLIDPWMDRHCGGSAPALLCAERGRMTHTSQNFLWGSPEGPAARHVFGARSDAERWAWSAMMGEAAVDAIRERPSAFLAVAARGLGRQFVHFEAIDDECPIACGAVKGAGIDYALATHRPAALPALGRSLQLRDATPKRLVRSITTPIAAFALILLPVATAIAWARRDRTALALIASVAVALLANAALAGALSDVHDRYQSRVVWLAPLLLALLAARWRACPGRTAEA